MHEHIKEYGLINMNGRLYDPIVGRMLSPDIYVQDPTYSPSYNRYSYVNNNPLKYTDPSGWTKMACQIFWDSYDYFPQSNPGVISGGSGRNPGFNKEVWAIISKAWTMTKGRGADIASFNYSGGEMTSSGYSSLSGINYSPSRGEYGFWFDYNYTGKDENGADISVISSTWNPIKNLNMVQSTSTTSTYSNNVQNGGGLPNWMGDVNTMIGAFGVGNSAKTELIDYVIRSNYKSATSWSQFNKLSSLKQSWRITNTLGKGGSQYLKFAKGLGYIGAGLSTAYTVGNTYNYFKNGGTDWQVYGKATLDVVMTGVGFLGPIGFGVSATYFILDNATGNFGGFGQIKP